MSGWISKVSADGQPRNAVKIIWLVGALLLCTILASPVAFTSLVSAAGVPTITAYALIACNFAPLEVCLTSASRSIFLDSGEIPSCEMESGEMVSAVYIYCPVLELVCGGSAVFTYILSCHGTDIQLLVCHLWGDHDLWDCVLVGDAGGRMVEDKEDRCCYRGK